MSDQQITCSECGGVFVFTEAEQQFYETKQLAAPPKRCKSCRQARRAAREGGAPGGGGGGFGGGGGGARGGFGGPGARPQPRRFSNDVNEYRSPMGPGGGGHGQAGGDRPAPGGFNARGARPARPGAGGPGGHAPNAGFRGREPSANGNARGGFGAAPQGELRGPSFPRDRGQWGTSNGPGASGGFGGGDRPRRPAPAREVTAPRPERLPPSDDPRQTRPRAERPRFDITCAECGAQAQVPFKPLEGRQVFCQTCYRARKGTAAAEPAIEPTELVDTDAGIVE